MLGRYGSGDQYGRLDAQRVAGMGDRRHLGRRVHPERSREARAGDVEAGERVGAVAQHGHVERLEALNVAVLGYGTDAFPGSYIARSGFPAPFRVDAPSEVTAIAHARDALGIEAAVLVARPVPTEHQLDADLHS